MSISEKTVKKYLDAAIEKRNRIEEEDRLVPQWETGTVKWFDRTRRFGFIYFDEAGDNDEAFLPWTQVQESNISEKALKQGTRVRFLWKPSRLVGGRPEVTRLALVDRRR